jgi:hypothetical protein
MKPNSVASTRTGLTRFSQGSHKKVADANAMGTEAPTIQMRNYLGHKTSQKGIK